MWILLVLLMVIAVITIAFLWQHREIVGGGVRSRIDVKTDQLGSARTRRVDAPKKSGKKLKTQNIVHVSGPPGAGKSTLGAKLKLKYPRAYVLDLDEVVAPVWNVIDDLEYSGVAFPKIGEAFVEATANVIAHRIARIKNRHILLVGIVGYVPEKTIYMPSWDSILKILKKLRKGTDAPQIELHKWYLEVPPNVLMTQLFTRDYIEPISKNPQYVKDLIAGNKVLPAFSRDVKEEIFGIAAKEHMARNFKFAPTQTVEDEVSRIIG